jgi:tripartite-type tricarboxylate transporter receptor subunit TctC
MRTAAHEGRSGAIRAYAVTAGARTPLAPDIPTADEAGVPRRHVSIWNGFWVPRATPKETIASFCREGQNTSAEWAFPALFGGKFYLPVRGVMFSY